MYCSHSVFRWDGMVWNITGEVEIDRVDAKEELCVREDVNQNIINHVINLHQFFSDPECPG